MNALREAADGCLWHSNSQVEDQLGFAEPDWDDHKNGNQSGQALGRVDTQELEHQPGDLGSEAEGRDIDLCLTMSSVSVAGRAIEPIGKMPC